MHRIGRREILTWFAIAPTLPRFLVESAEAAAQARATGGDRIVVVVRMQGGNDGLNTVVPFRDDRYIAARPTIAIPGRDVLPLPGGDLGLHPALSDVRALMDEGHAGIVQGVGYERSSRSHVRSTEIWETATVSDPAPSSGWLGRYLDHVCTCATASGPTSGVQFADALGRTIRSETGRSTSIGNPRLLLELQDEGLLPYAGARGPRSTRLDYLQQVQNGLVEASAQVRSATRGSGGAFNYPDTAFGQSLRWTADMIETDAPTRVYYVTIGSFEGEPAVSFDTHVDQLGAHVALFTELGRGLRAFTRHLRSAGLFDRVLLLTFSEFGREVAENRTRGTEHGDASVLFYAGGNVRAGLHGEPADLGRLQRGALAPSVDFRQIYADVLTNWLRVGAEPILGRGVAPYPITGRA